MSVRLQQFDNSARRQVLTVLLMKMALQVDI